MSSKSSSKKKKTINPSNDFLYQQNGYFLLSVMLGLAIISMVIPPIITGIMNYQRHASVKTHAEALGQIGKMLEAYYLVPYISQLSDSSPSVPNVQDPLNPSYEELVKIGAIHEQVPSSLGIGGKWTVEVTKNNGNLLLIVRDGQPILNREGQPDLGAVSHAVSVLGYAYGFSKLENPDRIFGGPDGIWNINNPLKQPAVLAYRTDSDSALWKQFVRRDGSTSFTGRQKFDQGAEVHGGLSGDSITAEGPISGHSVSAKDMEVSGPIRGGTLYAENTVTSKGGITGAFLKSEGDISAEGTLSARKMEAIELLQAGKVHSQGDVTARGNLMANQLHGDGTHVSNVQQAKLAEKAMFSEDAGNAQKIHCSKVEGATAKSICHIQDGKTGPPGQDADMGTGLSGIFRPLRGMQVECTCKLKTFRAVVHADGTPDIQMKLRNGGFISLSYSSDHELKHADNNHNLPFCRSIAHYLLTSCYMSPSRVVFSNTAVNVKYIGMEYVIRVYPTGLFVKQYGGESLLPEECVAPFPNR